MVKAKKTKEITEKLTFTVMKVDSKNRMFTYLDDNGDEQEGLIDKIFADVKPPFDVTLKVSNKEELDIQFDEIDEENAEDYLI